MPNTEKEPMEKIKQCSTCKHFKEQLGGLGICIYPLPSSLYDDTKADVHPQDGSDCNAYAGLEEVDTLERVKGILQTIKSDSQKVAEEISDQANTPSEFLPPDSYEPYDEGYNDAKRDFSDKLLSIINGETK